MMAATKSSYQRALDKARKLGTAQSVREVSPTRYLVSGFNAIYTVSVVAGELVCSCPAGQTALPCYHAAAVHMVRKGQEMTRRVAASQPIAQRPSDAQQRSAVNGELRRLLNLAGRDWSQEPYSALFGKVREG